MRPGIPLLTPGSPNPGTIRGALCSIGVRKIGKNLVITLSLPYASSTRYTVTLHQARMELKIQKYAAALMPAPTLSGLYAYRQMAIVEPVARQVRTPQRAKSRAADAKAFMH